MHLEFCKVIYKNKHYSLLAINIVAKLAPYNCILQMK